MEKKIELINEIIRVYDENEKLKRELGQANPKETKLKEENNKYISLINMGRKRLFDEIFYYDWNFPNVLVDPTHKNLVFLDFNQWVTTISLDVVNKKYLSYYSLEQLKDYFRKELEEKFNTLKEEKIEESKEKETQEKEG